MTSAPSTALLTTSRNGGAGPTGLLRVLAKDYLSTIPTEASIEWVCNHSRNTQLALFHGYIDIALTYERDQEALAAAEGWSLTAGCAFHDHFCLAGPISDPANIRDASSLSDAFRRIAEAKCLFHSRADGSATMAKEHSLWATVNLKPWTTATSINPNDRVSTSSTSAEWYKTSLLAPAEALITADAAHAYLLIDRATLLRQTRRKTIHHTTVFFEPTDPHHPLMNSCFALVSTAQAPFPPSAERAIVVQHFLHYLFSARGQDIVAGRQTDGEWYRPKPFFARAAEGFCSERLRGGVPRNGGWSFSLPANANKPNASHGD